MSLFKLSLLLLSVISHEITFEYPAPSRPDVSVVVKSARERIWMRAGLPCNFFLKTALHLITLGELMLILASFYGIHRLSNSASSVVHMLGPAEASQLTPAFVLGAFLAIAGGYIRLACYRTLGPLFTFEQCICKDHKLVTTGLYGVVRHPSYTGLLMNFLGAGIMHGWPTSWLRASGYLDVPWVKSVVAVWCFIVLACVVTIFLRLTDEDRILMERFGKEWESWSRRVTCKLVPFVY